MQRRASVLLGLVALAIVVGVSLWVRVPRSRSAALVPALDGHAESEPEGVRAARGAEAASETRASETRRIAEPSAAGGALGGAAVRERAPGRMSEELEVSRRLQAVDGITGAHLPGARFAWAGAARVERERSRIASDLASAVESLGESAVADSSGAVTLRPPPGNTLVVARFEELVACTSLYDLRGDTLALFRPRTLELRVVDSSGLPCPNAPLAIHAYSRQESLGALHARDDSVWTGRTDANGRVRLEHADRIFVQQHVERRAGVVHELAAVLRLATQPPTRAGFALEPWPAGPVVLTLPPCGSIVVAVADATGAAPPDGATVRVTLVGLKGVPVVQPLVAGRARIDSVQLDETVTLEVDFAGRRAALQRTLAGPTSAEPVIEVQLACDNQNPVLLGRLFGPDGRPVTNAWFRAAVRAGPTEDGALARPKIVAQYGRTDAQGAFALALVGELPTGRAHVVELFHPHSGEPQGRVRLELEDELEQVLLGDVLLERVQP